jgi:hypothetical protein
MGDSSNWKPDARTGISPAPTRPTAAPANRTPAQPAAAKPTSPKHATAGSEPPDNLAGRIVHDERGNAVWDWLKDTARIAIDSTSRLLKRLEVPELKMEDTRNEELRIESDRDVGGGYNPYGSSNAPPGTAAGGRSSSSNATRGSSTRGAGSVGGSRAGSGSAGGTNNAGGGYDPYGKGVTHKPGRKP